jgi:hypothetical protein
MLQILEKTPGLLFTLLLLAFVIGTMVGSVLDAKQATDDANAKKAAEDAASEKAVKELQADMAIKMALRDALNATTLPK